MLCAYIREEKSVSFLLYNQQVVYTIKEVLYETLERQNAYLEACKFITLLLLLLWWIAEVLKIKRSSFFISRSLIQTDLMINYVPKQRCSYCI